MHTSREPHLIALKRFLRYLCVSLDYSLVLRPSPTSELVVYTDADWAGCPDTRWSTFRLFRVLGHQLRLLGRQAAARRLSLQRRGREPRRDQRCGKGLLARELIQELQRPLSASPSSTVTTSTWFTSQPIPCIISARSTWISTYNLYVSVSLSVTFKFLASLQ
jgi:hypothetical protein